MDSRAMPFTASHEPDPCVRWRAWRLWAADGHPPGREMDYLRHARELQKRDDNPGMTPLPALVHVVDDDEAIRDSFRVMLEANGYAVRTWASGLDVLRAIPGLEPGCVVVDVRMPDIDGLTLLRRLRDRNVRLPIIVMTGHGDVPMAVQALKAGAVDFIEKPFVRESMIESIRVALRQTGSRPPADR